jgi:hypothetical protein
MSILPSVNALDEICQFKITGGITGAQTNDHPCTISFVPILAHLAFSFEARDLQTDSDNAT